MFKANPGIKILAETNTPYNAAPAQEAVTNLLFSNPQIDGVWSQGGALSAGAVTAFEKQGRKLVPITGENYRPFLEMWKQKKLTAWATQQPNWLAAFAVYAAVKALQGDDIPAYIDVPLPIIDESQSRQLPLPRQGLRRGRLHLLALRYEAVRRADREEPEEVASRHRADGAVEMGVQSDDPRSAERLEGFLRQSGASRGLDRARRRPHPRPARREWSGQEHADQPAVGHASARRRGDPGRWAPDRVSDAAGGASARHRRGAAGAEPRAPSFHCGKHRPRRLPPPGRRRRLRAPGRRGCRDRRGARSGRTAGHAGGPIAPWPSADRRDRQGALHQAARSHPGRADVIALCAGRRYPDEARSPPARPRRRDPLYLAPAQ